MVDRQKIGAWGEAVAVSFLIKKGYEIVEKNFKIREAEIDIVAWSNKLYFGRTLCFIEVKTRARKDGSAERSVGKNKITHMKTAAKGFCLRYSIDVEHTPIQFEQVSVYGIDDIRHYEIPVN